MTRNRNLRNERQISSSTDQARGRTLNRRFIQERYPHLVVLLSSERVSSQDRNRVRQLAQDLVDFVLKRNAIQLSASARRRLVEESAQRLLQNNEQNRQRLDTSFEEAARQTIDDEIDYLHETLHNGQSSIRHI